MNTITIAGRIGKDAELRHLQNGDAVASFSVADDQGRDKPAIWWRCSLFGKRGEALCQYLTKGSHVTVAGRVSEREYQKDGAPVKTMDVRVSEIALQGGKPPLGTSTDPAAYRASREPTSQELDSDIPF